MLRTIGEVMPFRRRDMNRTRWAGAALVAAAALAAAACGSSAAPSQTTGLSPSSPPPPTATLPATTAPPRLAAVDVHLVKVASIVQPLAMAVISGDPTLYVAEQTGLIVAVRKGKVDPVPVLDMIGLVSSGNEQGLLGLAFSLSGRFLYVNYTDTNGNTHVTEFAMKNGRADPSSRRDVLFVNQPFANHNGGNLVFGPDGYLYIGLGDGGSAGDPFGNGQSLSTLLGKMLRISPRPSGSHPYGIPRDNPFVGRRGARPEIWAFGLRNPWRYSFDLLTGDMWIGDVGQNSWEEVDEQPSGTAGGRNYGWNRMEANHRFAGSPPPGAVAPVFEYSHDGGGCAVTGGYVYRGRAIPDLLGAYIFGDFCLGRLEGLRLRGGRVVDQAFLGPSVSSLSSFGQDDQGELYVMSLGGGLYRLVPGR